MSSDKNFIYKKVIASGIGNVVEWYTFMGYGFLVDVISQVFFPGHALENAIILSFLLFSIGFLARPIGAVLFGLLGDKIGRQKTLIVSQLLMTFTTLAICLLPTYQAVGAKASLWLAICRLLQGISVAGEYTTSLCYLAETSSNNQRGKIVSTIPAGTALGIMLSSIVILAVRSALPHDALLLWGWRFCFFIGFILSAVGAYLRWNLPETETFLDVLKIHKIKRNKIIPTLKKKTNLLTMLYVTLLVMAYSYFYQLLYIWLPTFLKVHISFKFTHALSLNICMMFVFMFFILFSGFLSDKVTRKNIIMITSALIVILFPILFYMVIHEQNMWVVFLFWFVLSIVFGCFVGATSVFLSESYTPEVRSTALSLSYNIPYAVFGGLAPTLLAFFSAKGNMTGIYIITVLLFVMAFIVSFFIFDKTRKDIGVVRNGERGHA